MNGFCGFCAHGASAMAEAVEFGRKEDGTVVMKYTMQNGPLKVSVLNLGATICSVQVPDAKGQLGEICLGYDELKPYLDWTTNPYFGAVAGRCANRIAAGKFYLDGKQYQLATNNGPNHLHGGNIGFDKLLWTLEDSEATAITLKLISPDGDENYPGQVTARVHYSLPSSSTLRIQYEATTDAPTLVNLTNHSYWNLADGGISSVLDHEISLFADFYTPVDDTSIPTGEVRAVTGAMDLRQSVKIGKGIKEADNGLGYDHNYVLQGKFDPTSKLQAVAHVSHSGSGRWMTVKTDQPGVQFYTGNYLNGFPGRTGQGYEKHHGFCLETQCFPNAVNVNGAHFSNVVLRPGEVYRHHTEHEFGSG
ncbi:Galactose mutarotase (Aldose 1-epimerase) [Durusdinium trenchii]|uniref:Aldose 1-epimerase n=2 Tax=Durusdinium trenchii TaxID=1381693 RepID=A0ABP0KGB8_9DINO